MQRKRRQPRRHSGSDSAADIRGLTERIEAHFSKRFDFSRPSSQSDAPWILPKAEDLYETHDELLWNDPAREALKNELNSVKDLLSDKDIVPWHLHTQDVNLASKVVLHVRHRAQVELCTQAWCKFYEILCNFPLLPFDPNLTTLNSVHLCEAPGAFIAALNHYLTLNHTHMKLSWLATTYNPYYEGNKVGLTIPDDRLIKPTFERWDFGEDNTGNLFTPSNRTSLYEKAKKLGPIHLVTADGSIDCQNNPSEQEELVAPLQLVEVLAALRILAPHGSLVVKLFTCFEPISVCLMYFLNCIFAQVHVFKPGTSKRGNSEVYVIAINYHGNSALQSHLSKIETNLKQPLEAPMFSPQVVPVAFLRQMTECCAYFQKLQIDAIQENLRLFGTMSSEQQRQMETIKIVASKMFVKRFGLVPIDESAAIVKNKKWLDKPPFQNKPLRVGSLNQRKMISDLSWDERIPYLEEDLSRASQNFSMIVNGEAIVEQLLMPMDHCVEDIDFTLGKEFNTCWNSHFCDFDAMYYWNTICLCIQESSHQSLMVEEFDCPELAEAILSQLTTKAPSPSYKFIARNEPCQSLAASLETFSPKSTFNIHVDDLRYDSSSFEVCYGSAATVQYLSRFCDVVEHCGQGDGLIIAIGPLLSRVEVGLLYVLHCAFKKITLLSVQSSGQPVEFAVCHDYAKPIPAPLLAKLREGCDGQVAILGVLNIHSLFREPFYSSLHRFNSCTLIQRAKFSLNYLKTLAQSDAQTTET